MANNAKVGFLHDADARNDERCAQLIFQCGYEGYGIFWVLIEMLRASTNYRLDYRKLGGIAHSINVSFEKVKATVDCGISEGLFHQEDEHFLYSPSLRRRMNDYIEICEKRREAGKASAESRKRKYGNSSPIPYNSNQKNEQVFEHVFTKTRKLPNTCSNTVRTRPIQSNLSTEGGAGGEKVSATEKTLEYAKSVGLGSEVIKIISAQIGNVPEQAAKKKTPEGSEGGER